MIRRRAYGGVVLEQQKEPTFSKDIRYYANPEHVYIPVDEPFLTVKKGQHIFQRKPIMTNKDGMVTYCPLECRYMGIKTFSSPHQSNQTFALFETLYGGSNEDPGLDMSVPLREPDKMAPEEILLVAKRCSIVDEYDGEYLYYKLLAAKERGAACVFVNAIDDEPYVTSAMTVLYQYAHQVKGGFNLACRAIGAEEGQALIFADVGHLDTPSKSDLDGLKVYKMHSRYPLYRRIQRSYSSGRNVLIGVGALLHLYRACINNLPQTTCFVTIAGDCAANPRTYEIPIGTPIYEMLEQVGLIHDPQTVVLGGPMTGFSVNDLETPILATTRAVITYQKPAGVREEENRCIGCGRCVNVCPRQLMPYYLRKSLISGVRETMQLHPELCIGCGCCSYVCPMQIHVKEYVQRSRALQESAE